MEESWKSSDQVMNQFAKEWLKSYKSAETIHLQ